MNQTRLYKWIILTVLTAAAISFPQITKAGQMPSVPKGHDFTTVPADANYATDQLLVRFAAKENGEQRSLTEKNQILASLGAATVKHNFKLVPGLTLVKLPTGQTVKDALITFNGTNGILYAEPDYKIRFGSTFPNDTYGPNTLDGGEQWALYNIGQTGGISDADIDAPEAWDISTRSDIIVAVIDSGVDYTHPDLADNIWVNTGEIPDNGVDDDNNGYIDDLRGWNFDPNNNDPMDELGHGTHCAGIAGAVGDNNEGVTGVCWDVKIMALNIDTVPYTWEAFVSNACKAIDYAVNNGARVLNASWGGLYSSQSLYDEIYNAGQAGALFVACAHNNPPYPQLNNDALPTIYPASYDLNNIIAVLATDADDKKTFWSHYGATSVDLGAPGEDILSCAHRGGYQFMDGTSMATPYVAGAAALIWSRNQSLSHLQIKDIILNSVDHIPALNGLCVTGGRLNLYKAITAVPVLDLTIADNVIDGGSVLPSDEIIYTINYHNPVTEPCLGTVNDVDIIDYLPVELDFNSASGPNSYDPCARTVKWQIGTLTPGETGFVTLTVKVNELAEPLGSITNTCVIEVNEIRFTSAIETTDVNCWAPDIIYVNKRSPSWPKTGMSWKNAYTDLQDALENARDCDCNQIWVAKGTYRPTTNPKDYDANFALVDGVAVYGGFDGNETTLNQRNWLTNETILTGDTDDDGDANSTNVVTATNVTETASIDGFTITKACIYGIRCSNNASPTIRNNKIKDNYYYANLGHGVYCEDGSSANITNCEILNNSRYGIYCISSSPVIANNIIKGHNYADGAAYGIYLSGSSSTVIIQNNTITKNKTCGIRCSLSTASSITNCILWNNGDEIYNCTATYSCIKDCNDASGTGNICGDTNNPLFVDANAGNYHLAGKESPCFNKGEPNISLDPGEKDIDGEYRIMNGRVDMGADEISCLRYDDANEYRDWVAWGRPECWCYRKQCRGDANGAALAGVRVTIADLNIFKSAYGKNKADLKLVENGICADFNHKVLVGVRVTIADLSIFKTYYGRQEVYNVNNLCSATDVNVPCCDHDSNTGPYNFWTSPSQSGGEGLAVEQDVDIKALLEWLDELWLNGDLKEIMTEDELNKFIEALKEQSQN